MIIIGEPKLVKKDKKARLTTEIGINDEVKELWLEVDEKYSKYLVKDRCDAFVVAILPYALRNKKEIICNSTISEELLHNLRNQLIPALTKNSSGFYKSRISADINKKVIKNIEAVGMNLTLDINGFQILSKYLEPEYPNLKITHFCINDYVSDEETEAEKNNVISKNKQVLKSIELASELDVPYIHVKTNLLSIFDIDYKKDHLYCEVFPILALQKLFKLYMCESGAGDYSSFSVKNCDKRDSAAYGLLFETVFSRTNFKLYLAGGEKNTLEKLEDVIHFAQAHRFLHSCNNNEELNCGTCNKCVRTLLSLDALDRVDYFSQVFDTDYYKKNKLAYISFLEKAHENNDPLLAPVYNVFEKKKKLACSQPKVHVKGLLAPEIINSYSIILKDLTANTVLLSKQTREYMPAVLIGKVLSTLVALESERTQLVVDLEEGIVKGISKASIYDLINIMLNTQNNKVTNVIAQELYGSDYEFMEALKELMAQIKVKNTCITNPNGLGPGNYTTAEDTLKIMEYAFKNPHFEKIFKTTDYSFYTCDEENRIITFNPVLKPDQPFYAKDCMGARYSVQGSLANHIALFKKGQNTLILILLGIKDTKNELIRFSEVKNIMSCIP